MHKFLLLFLILACNTRGKEPSKTLFIKDISPKDSVWLDNKRREDSEVNHQSIENGVDGFEFRLSVSEPFIGLTYQYIVKEQNGKYRYFKNVYSGIPRTNKEESTRINGVIMTAPFFLSQAFQPSCSDAAFTNLLKTIPDTLRSQHEYCDVFVFDGTSYELEFATSNSYRFLAYYSPHSKPSIKANQQIMTFVFKFESLLSDKIRNWPRRGE